MSNKLIIFITKFPVKERTSPNNKKIKRILKKNSLLNHEKSPFLKSSPTNRQKI